MPSPSEIARSEEWAKEPAEPSENGTMEPASKEQQFVANAQAAATLRLDIVRRERELDRLKSQLNEIEEASAGLLREIKGEPAIPEESSRSLKEALDALKDRLQPPQPWLPDYMDPNRKF